MKFKNWTGLKYFTILLAIFTVSACEVESDEATSTSEFTVASVSDYKFMFNDEDVGGIINFSSQQLSQCTLTFALKNFVPGYEAKVSQQNDQIFDLSCISDSDSFELDPSAATYASMKVVTEKEVVLDFELVGFNSKDKVKKSNVALKLSESQLQALLANGS